MDNNIVEPKLKPEEERELSDAVALFEMDQSNPGWQIVKGWLEQMAYHSWVDPRDVTSKKDWEWRELNAFHAANNAKELLENIAKAYSDMEYLDKVKNGQIDRKKVRI